MGIIRFAIDQPITVAVGAILVALFGLVSLTFVPIQLTPDIDRPRATVMTFWPGASPFEIEREIIDEQEEQLKGLDGLLKIESESHDGFGQIVLEFPVGMDPDSILVRVSNRLEQVPAYPDDVDKPVIYTVDPGAQAMAWFMIYAEEGYDIDPARLGDFVDDFVKPRIERVPGVAQINLFGGREREMQVRVDPDRLAARGLTMTEVAAALSSENKDYSAGDFREGKRRYVVRTAGDYRSPEDVENVVISTSGEAPVYVRDVGYVELGFRKPSEFVRALGKPALAFNAQKAPGTNVLDVMREVRKVVVQLNAELLRPQGLRLDIAYQETDYIESAIALVRSNIFVGGALALIVLLLFLRSLSGTFVVGLSIPISVVATFLVMAIAGRSINVISLAGLAFAVGMVVDNCIVVLENIYRHRQMGKTRRQSALDGAVEVWGAVLASTLTTVAVFLPVIFVQDEAGQLFRDIALAVSASVLASLVTAMTLIPTLSARVLGGSERGKDRWGSLRPIKRSIESGFGSIPGAIADTVATINRTVARRVLVIVVLTGLSLGGSWLLMPDREYLPQGNSNFVIGIMSPPPGYSPEEIGRIGEGFETELLPRWQVEAGSAEAIAMEGGGIRDYFYAGFGSLVFIGMRAKDSTRTEELVPVLQQLLTTVPGTYGIATQWSIFEADVAGGSINVDVRGDDLPTLIEIGAALLGQTYGRIPGVQVLPQPSLDLANPEIRLVPDRRRMADVGLTNRELGFTVDALVDGAKVSDYRIDGREIDLVLMGDESTFRYGHDLASITINTPSGKLVTLGSVAQIEPIGGPTQVNHHDRQRAIRLQVTPPRGMPLETAMNVIRDEIVGPARESGLLPPGVSVQLTGTADDLTRTAQALVGNFVLAVVVTYLLMAALFQSWTYPLVIMFSVPLATFGGFLGLRIAHAVTGQNLDVLTMLGFVILIGIVVNNAILIVHQSLNLMRDETMPSVEAIPEAVRIRVRPIFMSTLTSIVGMAPLVLFPGAGSELYRGLGSVVIGGLALSTVFTLFLVPALFSLVVDTRARLADTLARRRHAGTTPAREA